MKVKDGSKVTIGGMITHKTIKHTKNQQTMAFLTIEDLVGTVEVIVWPRDYERNKKNLNEESKVFITGRVDGGEEKDGKLICERIRLFEEEPRKLWIKFQTKEEYQEKEEDLLQHMKGFDGGDAVVIYIGDTREMKSLPPSQNVAANKELIDKLSAMLGKENVKVV